MIDAPTSRRALLALVLVATTLAVAPSAVSPAAAAACDKTWTDPTTGGMWEKAGVADATETQWSPVGVPDADDVVCLPAGDYHLVVFPGDQSAYEIEGLVMEESAPGEPVGTFSLEADLTASDAVDLDGSVRVYAGSGLTAPTVTQTSGEVHLMGVIDTDTYTLDSGLLRGDGYDLDWDGLITGDLVNTGTGTVAPGHYRDASTMTIGGDYTQGGLGTLHLDYRTAAPAPAGGPGYGYDRLQVDGTATLGGTVDVDLEVRPESPERSLIEADLGITGAFATGLGVPKEWVEVIDGPGSVEMVDIVPKNLLSDVPESHAFLLDIAYLVSHEITSGYPDGTFRPTTSVSRQSMAAFLHRLMGAPPFTPPTPTSFSDVGATHGFLEEIEWLAAEDITGGFADGTFRPRALVTRGSMAAFLYRLAGEPTYSLPPDPTFADVGLDHAFRAEIEWAAGYGIASGFSDATFRPGEPVNRQHMAAFIRRFVYAGWLPS